MVERISQPRVSLRDKKETRQGTVERILYFVYRNGKETRRGTVERILYFVYRNAKETRQGTVERILYVVNGNVKKEDSERMYGNTVHHILYVARKDKTLNGLIYSVFCM